MMSGYVVQVALTFLLTTSNTQARKPPGYVAQPKEYDPNPPKYEYGYRIQEDKTTHGKDEQRDGIYAQGRYYVENGTQSSQQVKYFADDWGYHPVVEYSHTGPYSTSSTNFVLGEEAIKLKNNQKSIPQDGSDPGKAENLAKTDQQLNLHEQQINPKELQMSDQPQVLILPPVTVSQKYEPCPNPTIVVSPTPSYSNNLIDDDQSGSKPENRHLVIESSTPQPEALIWNQEENLERAALIKIPNQIVRVAPRVHYTEFGNRLQPKQTNKLIESTRDYVSGVDVLNINAAVSSTPSYSQDLETNALHTLLHKYVTPSLSTTTPVSTQDGLLSQPIVVADKPEDNNQEDSEEILVTPRPIASKFLAPITAGVRLQQVEEQQSANTETIEQKENSLNVEVLKSTPYYLGMYQYPLGLDSTENLTSNVEAKAVHDVELGKTLLYFPEVQLPKNEGELQQLATPQPVEVDYLKQPPVRQPYLSTSRRPGGKKFAPTSTQGAYLQIPGLFSKQKYNTLLQNYRQPSQQFYYHSTAYPAYAPQANPYHPPKPLKPKLKLDLLVFPRANVFNLPPITNQNVRHSNAKLNNAYLPPAGSYDAKSEGSIATQYLVPPKQDVQAEGQKQRSARAHFDEKSVRMEYGFKPPLRPSVEIDEYGRPIERDED